MSKLFFWASTSAGFFFAEMVSDGDIPGVESTQREDCALHWCNVSGGVKTDKGFVDGAPGIKTKGGHFFVGAVRQVLFRNEGGPWG